MVPIPVRLSAELLARLDRVAGEMSISRSAVLRLAIQQWLDATERFGSNPLMAAKQSPRRGSQTDDASGASF
jgi:metal-responsive CopG/Arc/MetJ family transcriptional regulator